MIYYNVAGIVLLIRNEKFIVDKMHEMKGAFIKNYDEYTKNLYKYQ